MTLQLASPHMPSAGQPTSRLSSFRSIDLGERSGGAGQPEMSLQAKVNT